MKSKFTGEEYLEPEIVRIPMSNFPPGTFCGFPVIAPDESYLIFTVRSWSRGQVNFELYVTFHDEDGSWSEPRNIGDKIGLVGNKTSASISPDGQFFFFINNHDIYWVDAKVIEELKPEELK